MNILKPMLFTLLTCASATLMAADRQGTNEDTEKIRVAPSTPSSTYKPSSDYTPTKRHTQDSVSKEYGFKDSKDFKKWYDEQ